MGKKLLSTLMSIVLVVSLCPSFAFAAPTDYTAGKIAPITAQDGDDESEGESESD